MCCGESNVNIPFLKKLYKDNYNVDSFRFKTLRFLSTTQDSDILTSDYVPDSIDGYTKDQLPLVELEKLSDSIEIITGNEDIYKFPYGDRLRPLEKLSDLRTAKHIIVLNCTFTAFDCSKDGSTNQDADANQIVIDSQGNTLGAYAIGRGFTALPSTWLNNYFRPTVQINGNNIIDYQETEFGTNNRHSADSSVGIPLPSTEELYLYFPSGIQNIVVRGICGQLISNGIRTFLKRYAILTTIKLAYV